MNTSRRPSLRLRGALSLLALGTALAGSAAHGQASASGSADNPVLTGKQVNEQALIDALTIDSPADAASGATRGFRAAKPNAAPVKAGPGRASLLITFATNSTELSPETLGTLGTLAKALQSDALAGFSFRVEGHADARGDAQANERLSQQRAEAVKAYLIDKQGILPERLMAVGKGSTEPLNKTRVDAPENRRVTIVTTRD